jgi:MFS family permease
VSWRWSFFINLPIGALAAFLVAITTKISEPEEKKNKTLQQKLREFDWIGTILFVPSIICILLALQWGGSTYAWDSGRVIALIIIFVLGTAAFVHSQIQQGERSTVPPRIMKQRSMAFASAYAFCLSAAFDILQYFVRLLKKKIAFHADNFSFPFGSRQSKAFPPSSLVSCHYHSC